MMPEIRALFPATRLLPGRGATMRGYGDKLTLAGVQATGAGGVITLQRSDQSGMLPSLGGGEQPVQLRAGPGMRIHGYGGIHTLERLPLPPEETLPQGPAMLEWEVEQSWGRVSICSLGGTDWTGNWFTIYEYTYNFTGGSYVDTQTASGVITAYGPDDPLPDACAAIVYNSTYDPEIDYGDATGGSGEEKGLVAVSSLVASALAAMSLWQTTTGSQTWERDQWKDVSEEVTPFTHSFGLPIGITYGVGATVYADNLRFRLRNRGSASLRVDCGFYGSGISGGATDIPAVLDLAPGATSAWQEVPSIDPDPAKYYTAEIRRVRIGRFRTIP